MDDTLWFYEISFYMCLKQYPGWTKTICKPQGVQDQPDYYFASARLIFISTTDH